MDDLTRERMPPKPWEIVNRWGDTYEQIEARQRALWRDWRDPVVRRWEQADAAA